MPNFGSQDMEDFQKVFLGSSEFRATFCKLFFGLPKLFLSHSLTYFCFRASSWSFPSSFFVFETCESRYMLGCFLIHFITCLVVWLQICLVEIKKWLLKIKSSCLHEPSLCSLFAQMIAILLSLHMPKVGPKHQTYFQCPVKLPREPKESSSL